MVGVKILLADDSPHAQRDGSRILAELGYEVATVSNGSAALKRFEEEPPDLLIADTSMPGLTGLEVCQRIKGNPHWAATPVLLALAAFELYDAEQGRQAGADAVIQKPFIPSALEKSVAELLLKAGKDVPTPRAAAPPVTVPATPTAEALQPVAASEAAPQAAPEPEPEPPPPARPRWQIEEIEVQPPTPGEEPHPDSVPEPVPAVARPVSAPDVPLPLAVAPEPMPAPPAWHWPASGWSEPAHVEPAPFSPSSSETASPVSPELPPTPAQPSGDELLLDALREVVVEPPAPPSPPRIDLAAALAAVDEVLADYLAPMLADEVKDQIARRLRALESSPPNSAGL